MRTINPLGITSRLHYYLFEIQLVFTSAVFLFFIVAIVYSIDKEVERIGVGVVIECPPVRSNFFIGAIHRATVKVRGDVIENVRLHDCVKAKEVSVTKKHKYWGFKGHYAASYRSKK